MSMCCRISCAAPSISFEEWCRNDGCCDACAVLMPSMYFTARSNDYIQQGAVDAADQRWHETQAAA